MTDGLKDTHRTAIIDLLRANERVERAVLFGSRAMETFTHGSDVDIALFGEFLTTADQACLAAAMEKLDVPQMVDLLLYEGIADATLREHVRRDGIELYRRQENASVIRLHLLPKHRQVLEVLLREHLPDVEVWVYGSRVNGRSHNGSNLDLVLRRPDLTEIPSDQLGNFEEAVRESDIPFLVEVRDWVRLPKRFQRKIEQNHVVLMVGKECGSLNPGWETVKIGDISEKVAMGPFGSSIKVSTFVPEGIPIISGQHLHGVRVDDSRGYNFITEEHAQRLANANVQQGDVVITHRGNIGQVSYIPKNSKFDCYVVSQSQCYMRCDHSKVIPEFVTNYFRSYEGQHKLLANTSQVGVPSIAKPVTYLRTIELLLPSLPEQCAIAHILGALDDKIELNRRMNETLEAMARAIFKDWFVDFGPVRAKMEGRTPYLSPEIWGLFPDTLDNEDKPVGWESKPLDEIAEFLNGLALQRFPASDLEDSLPVIKIAELRGGITLKTNRASCDVPEKYIVEDGDFLFSWSGSLLAKFWTGGTGALNQHLFKVTSDRFPTWFFSQWVHHHLSEFQEIAAAKATTMGHIQRGHLKAAVTICPPVYVLAKLGQTISALMDRTIANELESRTLIQIRGLLLPKLISGEIRLTETKKAMPTAT